MNNSLRILSALVTIVGAIMVGRFTANWWSTTADGQHDHSKIEADTAPDEKPLGWTCPMHPQIKAPDPGDCPICGMDLTPIQRGENLGPRELAMSQEARKLAGIETAPISRRFLTKSVRMVGKVAYDETAVRTISARVPGRLDRMFVDYTGISVKPGDHLVSLYSPELLTAQRELIEVKKRMDATSGEESEFLRRSTRKAYESSRDKLLLWGLTRPQVDAIEKNGVAEDHMLINSTMGGVVIEKMLKEGDYVKEGTKIFRIANLDKLWLRLDAYEQDLPWLRFGQQVTMQAEGLPGEVFKGWISFIDPVLHDHTRTVKVRVNVDNLHGKLKPGMFVRAVVRSRIADSGRVLASRLAGKWISPMHPEIVRDRPGKCDVCGMDLVPAAELGYVASAETEKPLVVPASAVLVTGTRAVVYIQLPGKKRPTFEGRVVILGARAGDYYIVRAGLRENDQVVVNGAFRIDSSMQIQAKPSMLSMAGESSLFIGSDTANFRVGLGALYSAYFDLSAALAGDDLAKSRAAVDVLRDALSKVDSSGLSLAAEELWLEDRGVLHSAAEVAAGASSLDLLRASFDKLSRSVLSLARRFRHAGDGMHFEAFCPMAFDNRGAAWLQSTKELRNPYFGSQMLRCGEFREQYEGIQTSVREADESPAKVETVSPPPKVDPKREQAGGVVKVPRPAETTRAESKGSDALSPVFDAYFALQTSLAADDLVSSRSNGDELVAAWKRVPEAELPKGVITAWNALSKAASAIPGANTIDALREEFGALSKSLIETHAATGHSGSRVFYRMHCPMAFDDKGADWLQIDKAIRNPYFGSSMLRCGSVEQSLPARKEQRSKKED